MIKVQNRYPQIKFVVLLLLMASLPFAIKVTNAFILVSVLVSILPFFLERKKKPLINWLAILAVLFLLCEALSLLYTKNENIKTGLSELETHLPFLFVPFIFRDSEVLIDKNKYLSLAFVTGCLIASLFCLIVNIQLSLVEGKLFHEFYFSHDRISDPIGMQAVYFALYISLCVLIITNHLLHTFSGNSNFKNMGLGILLMYFLLMIVASGARTTIVALMFIMILNIVAYAIVNRKYGVLLISSLIPVFFVLLVLFNPVVKTRFGDLRHTKTEGSNYDSYFARINIWKPGLDVLRHNILLGVGIGDQQEELNTSYNKNSYLAGVEFRFNMHNQYMQVMLATGIIGLSIFLLILGLQIISAIRNYNFLYLSFILLFSLASLTESTLNRSKGVILFTLFSFIFYNSVTKAPNKRSF